MKKKFILCNNNDTNDTFVVNAENELEAAFQALSELGWGLYEDNQIINDPDQYEFDF